MKSPGEGAASQLRAGRTGVQTRYFSVLKHSLLGVQPHCIPTEVGVIYCKNPNALEETTCGPWLLLQQDKRDPTPRQVYLCLKALAGPFSPGLPFPTFFPDDLPLKF